MDLEILVNYWPRVLDGFWTTIFLTVTSVLLGAILALPLAIARISGPRPLSLAAATYITFFRGTPMLAQLFLLYYGAGQFRPLMQDLGIWWFLREPLNCAILTFTLNTAAYQAETLRGGILGVPFGHVEAARACGMTPLLVYRRIILPVAYRIAMPALGNEVILLMKGSAIASVIAIADLMGSSRIIFSRSFEFDIYLWAALLYLLLTFSLERLWAWLERWLNPARPA